MKRIVVAVLLCLGTGTSGLAQQTASDSPATKEDIQKYLEVTRSREMITKMIDAMSKPVHQMIHEEYLKDQDKLPADFEERENQKMDDSMKAFPWDEMLQAMVPVYQKHFTKGDVNALTAFYSSPTGQKILREMPAITAEAMQSVMPMLQKHMAAIKDLLQQEIAQMTKGPKAQVQPN